MNNTIEPRLIALLNEPSLELPPLQHPSIFAAAGRPLLLEPDAPIHNAQLGPQHGSNSKSNSNLTDKDVKKDRNKAKLTAERALGISSPQSLRKILDNDPDKRDSVSSKKRPIVENNKDDFVQLPQPPKKHKSTTKPVVPPIIIGLLEPPPQTALFPPIASSSFHDSHGRNTLNTVPTNVEQLKEATKASAPQETEEVTTHVKPSKKKDVLKRRKWTEEETNNLLLGVAKHGVGNWALILDDPAFSFNGRSRADLKDRFRTCCPSELRDNASSEKHEPKPLDSTSGKGAPQEKPKSSLMTENILIDDADPSAETKFEEAAFKKAKKSRAHRKNMEDLAQLGIAEPFRKSQRRERRAFTEEEDGWILEGYKLHGPAWTKIQKDSRFRLQSRQPTDLRDRFRNKFPEKFRSEEKGDPSKNEAVQSRVHSSPPPPSSTSKEKVKEGRVSNPVRTCSQTSLPALQSEKASSGRLRDSSGKETAVIAATQSTLSLQTSGSREGLRIQEIISPEDETSKQIQPPSLTGFKDNFGLPLDHSGIETAEGLPFSQSFDWGGSTAPFTSNMGEMDISRLLLDESWIDNPNPGGKEKLNLTDINSILNSNSEQPSNPSFSFLLGETEPMPDLHESPFG